MSKAFTREDDLPDPTPVRRLSSPLPSGASNYLTPDGAARMRVELERLLEVERPAAVASVGPLAREQVALLDQRIQHLQQSLQTAVIVEPPPGPQNQVRFGVTVTVRDAGGVESHYRIVGIDEADPDRGWVSWLSPIAKALLNAKRGQKVHLKLPSRDEELEIVSIDSPVAADVRRV
jgi:transcription elongation factor GreB